MFGHVVGLHVPLPGGGCPTAWFVMGLAFLSHLYNQSGDLLMKIKAHLQELGRVVALASLRPGLGHDQVDQIMRTYLKDGTHALLPLLSRVL